MCERGDRYDYGPRSDNIRHIKNYDAYIYEQWCLARNKKPSLDLPSIFYPAKDAVVSVFCTTNNDDGTTIEQSGSGFFIGKLTVVTAAHVVMYNNVNVDRSPPVIAVANPNVTPAVTATGFARVGTIQVRVNNVNGSGDAYFYNAKLLGMSPSFDLAVIQVEQINGRACQTPPLQDHPILEWGCSRSVVIGERVIIVGDSRNAEAIGMSHGVVTDNLYSDDLLSNPDPGITEPAGYWGFEAIVSDAQAAYENSGGPLLNDQGRVIGVISGIDTSAYSVAPPFPVAGNPTAYIYRTVSVAEHVARRIVRALANGRCDPALRGHVEEIQDPLGNYNRYNYGYLGVTGFYAFGFDFLRLVPDSQYKRQKGFVITGVDPSGPLAGIFPPANLYPYPDTDNPPAPVTPTAELWLVTEINGTPVGVGPGQIPFSSITYLQVQNMVAVLNYRRGSENFKCSYQVNVYLGYLPLTDDLPPNAANQTSALLHSLPSRNSKDLVNAPLTRGINLDAFNIQHFLTMLSNAKIKQAIINLLPRVEGFANGAAEVIDHVPQLLQYIAKIAQQLGLNKVAAGASGLVSTAEKLSDVADQVSADITQNLPAAQAALSRGKPNNDDVIKRLLADIIVNSDVFTQALEQAKAEVEALNSDSDSDSDVDDVTPATPEVDVPQVVNTSVDAS